MTSEEKDNLLDRYVTGQPMSIAEENQVNQWLDTDPDFRLTYRLQQELFDAGRRQRRTEWESRQPTPRAFAPRTTAFPMRWAAAASVVLLLGIGLVWWLQKSDANQPLMGQAALYEQRDNQLGLAPNDSAVGQVTWIVTKADADAYEFGQADTLRIFSTNPNRWQNQTLKLVRLSEVRYELRAGNDRYRLKQGREFRLPLEPEN